MKYVISMDSFKGSLSAKDACTAAMNGVKRADREAEAVLLPLADGGEGTADAVVSALGGSMVGCRVTGPFGESENGYYGKIGEPGENDSLAVIDTAAASGIVLAKAHGLDPMTASTYGTGMQIKEMLDLGYRRIAVGLGGSGTNDGGTGALMALGAVFYDKNGEKITKQGGQILAMIGRIDLSALDCRLTETELRLMYDVSIPLTGEHGASLNYSHQKGADEKTARELESGMENYASAVTRLTGKHPNETSGTGAAGGLGCGLMLAGGILTEGAPYMLKLARFSHHASQADLIITGEGKTDFQTASGKLPVAVAREAKKYGKTVVCVCGAAAPTKDVYESGIDAVFSIADRPMTVSESMNEASRLIEETCFNIAGLVTRYDKK